MYPKARVRVVDDSLSAHDPDSFPYMLLKQTLGQHLKTQNQQHQTAVAWHIAVIIYYLILDKLLQNQHLYMDSHSLIH